MATVNLGGRDLRVLGRDDPGGFRTTLDLARLGEELHESKSAVMSFRKMAEMVFVYVRGNDGVTLEWVLDALPANITRVLQECSVASGRELPAKEQPVGEAAAPTTRV